MCARRYYLGVTIVNFIFFALSCHDNGASARMPATQENTTEVSITIHQPAQVPRPLGDVELVCEVTGITSNDVKYYWWLEKETDTPIYIFSESYNIDEITKGFSDIVISETHVISEGKITSKLKLHMNLTSNDFFKCEFAMMDSTIFSEAVKIDFEAMKVVSQIQNVSENPHIEIAVEHYNSPIGAGDTIVLIATCNVTESDGEPKMAVFCNGSSFDEIISQEFVSEDHADHFSATTEHHERDTQHLAVLICLGIAIYLLLGVTAALYVKHRRAKKLLRLALAARYPPCIEADLTTPLPDSTRNGSIDNAAEVSQSLMANEADALNQNTSQ